MRIAFVYDAIYPWVTGGAERRFWELGQRLRADHEVTFVGWQWWDGPSRISKDSVDLLGVGRAPALYGADGKRTVREAVAFSLRVAPAVLRGRWDVIDCSATPYLPLYPVALAARLRGTRLISTWHEFWGPHWHEYLPSRPFVARAARSLEAGARRLGDRVVSVSDFTARSMSMAGDPRLEVVPNGVDVSFLRAAAPVPDGAEVVFVGRLIDEKRVDLLVDAIAQLEGVRCTIVGDGPERPALEARVFKSLEDSGRVRFTGRIKPEAVAAHLRAARILVLPSIREGYGMTVAEAQAAGVVPVVVRSPFSAAPDLVRDGVDGVVVEPDADAIAAAIRSLLDDPARLAAMSQAASAAGAERDWDSIARRMESVYRGHTVEAASESATTPERRLTWP